MSGDNNCVVARSALCDGILVKAYALNGYALNGAERISHASQKAQIKIETFNFTRYGLISGKVLDVSRDAVTDKQEQAKPRDGDRTNGDGNSQDDQAGASAGYVAHVALDSTRMLTEGGPVELGPGMSVTAEIKTGQRRVISYLLSPISRYRRESLRER